MNDRSIPQYDFRSAFDPAQPLPGSPSLQTPRNVSLWRRLTPPQLFVGSFLILIVLGTIGLKSIPHLYTGAPLSWLEALFTATSAVCVTGLIVVDTATFFTTAGQAFILLLVQLGGLGIVTFTTVIIITLGRRLSLRHEQLASDLADVTPHVEYRHLIRNVFVFTAAIEGVGALMLYALWVPDMGWAGAIWPAVFHSVSAFCNAGFSIFSDSLVGFQRSPLVQLSIMILIICGGIGFLTLDELYLMRKARRGSHRFRFSVHSRLVLVTTAVLLVVGWGLFTVFEWNASFKTLPVWAKVLNGLFASVTARTAGFNTIDYGMITDSTAFLTVLLMSIGGSPGSTAGGIKTTTVALIGILAWSRFRGRATTSLWSRTIPDEIVQRSVGLFVIAVGIVTTGIFILTTTDLGNIADGRASTGFLTYMFEASSAFNTVGLSMGATGHLTIVARWTTIVLMFVGRVGTLMFVAALSTRIREPIGGLRYAYENVIIG